MPNKPKKPQVQAYIIFLVARSQGPKSSLDFGLFHFKSKQKDPNK